MHKEEDKLSLNMNEDFTLPSLEESLTIEEIPTIEDLISIDKEEVEKIQETAILDEAEPISDEVVNFANATSVASFENVSIEDNFTTSFNEMNLFDEDIALTLDNTETQEETPLQFYDTQDENISDTITLENSEEIKYEQEEAFTTEEIIQLEEDTSEELVIEDSDNIQDDITEEIIAEASTADVQVQEQKEIENSTEQDDFTYLEEISDQTQELFVSDTQETVEEISIEVNQINENIYTGETKYYTRNDDVFAKIDSLLNDDSAFETGVTPTSKMEETNVVDIVENSEELEVVPSPKYRKSSFNPAKYLKPAFSLTKQNETDEKLGILYAARKVFDNIKTISEELNATEKTPFSAIFQSEKGKKTVIATTVCAVVLGAGITGVSLFNNKSVEEIEALNQNDVTTPLENTLSETPDMTPPPAVIDENASVEANTPDLNKIQQPKVTVSQDTIKQEVQNVAKQTPSESYLSVKKIQWQVPDYLSYSPNIKAYLQAAGKSIKLELSSDLLLATEYAYSNVIKVNLNMNKSGAVQNAIVATSSGSKQIDSIVLQSVKSTLNVVKPPVGEVKTPDYNLTISIYL